MPEQKNPAAATAPAADAPEVSNQPFDDFAATAARTAVWPVGALSAFASSTKIKKKS